MVKGAGLEQVKVEVMQFTGTVMFVGFTDGTGRVDAGLFKKDTYVVRASRQGYVSAETSFTLMGGETRHIVNLEMSPEDASGASASPVSGQTVTARELSIPGGARDLFQKAVVLSNAHSDRKVVASTLERAIAAYPGYYEAHFLLGLTEVQGSDPAAAEASFRKALELKPSFGEASRALALVLERQKRYDEAAEVVRKAMALDPNGWRWPFELSRIYGNQGRWEEAKPLAIESSQKPGASAEVHLLLADLYSNSREPSKAISELELFQKLEPDSKYIPRVQHALAELKKQQGTP